MSNNKEKRGAGMCELCQLDLASMEGTEAAVRNERVARRNRDYLDLHGVTAINLVSTLRSGKTSLLESTIPALLRDYRIAVVLSDLASHDDVSRMRALGIATIQVMTGSTRHLDATLLERALRDIVSPQLDLLFIESAGNLACPASLCLGQHHNVALMSVPDGDDLPAREPAMFRAAELVLLTKTDLLEAARFDDMQLRRYLRAIGCDAPLLGLSSRRGIGVDVFCEWLRAKEAMQSLRVASLTPEPEQQTLPGNPRVRYN